MNNKIKIADVPFNPVTYNQVLLQICEWMKGDKKKYITTPNPEMILDAKSNSEFRDILQKSSLSVPDGTGVMWASYYLSLPFIKSCSGRILQLFSSLTKILFSPSSINKILPERVTGSDLLYRITDESQKRNWRIFLLGAKTGVAKRAVNNLLKIYPKAVFAGAYSGSPQPEDETEIQAMINRSKADIVFVAYGHPAQEIWIARNLEKLSSVKLAVGVGGAFDFAAGITHRAPLFMQKIGLEWLWRLIQEPKRIKRIWKATVVFFQYIYRLKLKN